MELHQKFTAEISLEKSLNIWKLTFSKKKKICESKKDKRQYRKYFELNKDESTCLNLWDASKIVLGGDIRTLAYSRKKEKAHINDLGFHLK